VQVSSKQKEGIQMIDYIKQNTTKLLSGGGTKDDHIQWRESSPTPEHHKL
jgi:hypothetical protein